MVKEIYSKVNEIELQHIAAVQELNRLQSSKNKLSSNPAQQKKQMEELRNAQIQARRMTAVLHKLYDMIAEAEADTYVITFMDGLDSDNSQSVAEE